MYCCGYEIWGCNRSLFHVTYVYIWRVNNYEKFRRPALIISLVSFILLIIIVSFISLVFGFVGVDNETFYFFNRIENIVLSICIVSFIVGISIKKKSP